MPDALDNKKKVGPWLWTEWPTFPMPTEAWIADKGRQHGPRWVDDFHNVREQSIFKELNDPLVYGWESPPMIAMRQLLKGTYVPGKIGSVGLAAGEWKQAEPANDVLALGGNGSGKTDCEAKIAMEVLVSKPNQEARCFSQNEQTSVRYIQRAMFRYLPPQFRKVKRQGQTTKISYQEATGFSESIFVLPNHGTGLFPTYKGWEQDKKSVEGGECHVLTWDEEMPQECLATVRYRAHKTGGFVLGGFTPTLGYTETVADYLEGMTILETIPAREVVWDWWTRTWTWGAWLLPHDRELVKGCPPGHVPFVLQSGAGKGRRFAVLFPTMFNPYTNVRAILDSTTGAPLEFALERLWGWPTKLARKAFPNFGPWHVVRPEKLPAIGSLSIYNWADPHGQRNWFIVWVAIDSEGRKWLLKEWPAGAVGEWALPGNKPDGKAGPAQTYEGGKSFNDYKRLILEQEGWRPDEHGIYRASSNAWTPTDRRMDPRPAGTSVPSDEESKNYVDHMGEAIRGKDGKTIVVPGLDFMAGPHCGIEEGVQLVNDWLTGGWDPKKPVDPMNCPTFYINAGITDHTPEEIAAIDPRLRDGCPNTMWALRTYTGADGEKGACKDPIDCLKGAAKLDIQFIAKGMLGTHGKSFGY